MNSLFLHEYLFRTPKRAWITALACVAALLISAPILPHVADWVRVRGLLHATMLVMFIAPLIYVFAYLINQVRVAHWPAYLILLLTLTVAVALTLPGRDTPEHVHVLVYALLSLFFYKLYSFYLHGIAAYALPLLTAFAVGVLDEFTQGLTPGRYMDFRDIADNAVGAFVGIAFVYIRRHYGLPRGGSGKAPLA